MSMNLMISVCGQLAGNSVLTYYMPAMYTVLGITSTDRRLLLTFANSIVSCFCAICGSATNDMIGRRTKLWVGSIVLSCLFACVTGFSSQFGAGKPVNIPLSNAGVAAVSQIVYLWTPVAC
jgi:MFS family permease